MPDIPILDEQLWFPDPSRPRLPEHPGLVALGGDLNPERLLLAYRSGIFPWSAKPITWWSPDPRALLDLHHFHVPKSVRKVIRSGRFRISRDHAFDEVVRQCSLPSPDRPETWIAPEFIEAYTTLHRLGHAHSVECWHDGQLAGGIYGVAAGAMFAGESMFFRVSNASKVALCALARYLKHARFRIFDIQMITDLTQRFGAYTIPRDAYLERLKDALRSSPVFQPSPPYPFTDPDRD